MIIAAIYPVFLWFFVFRFRRTWPGLALAVVGTLMVWPVARFAQASAGSTGTVLARLVYAEMALIGLVSVWLVTMRRPPTHPVCPYCRYDLSGLPATLPGALCPECGNELNPPPNRASEPYCLSCGRALGELDPAETGQACPGCGAGEESFSNWRKAKEVLARAEAERNRRPGWLRHGRSAR